MQYVQYVFPDTQDLSRPLLKRVSEQTPLLLNHPMGDIYPWIHLGLAAVEGYASLDVLEEGAITRFTALGRKGFLVTKKQRVKAKFRSEGLDPPGHCKCRYIMIYLLYLPLILVIGIINRITPSAMCKPM